MLTVQKLITVSTLLLLISYNTRAEHPPVSALLEGGAAVAGAFLQAWRAGDVVALIRHTERCDYSDNPCFDGDEGITVVGRDMAEQLGIFFAELPDVNQHIFTSPVKRT